MPADSLVVVRDKSLQPSCDFPRIRGFGGKGLFPGPKPASRLEEVLVLNEVEGLVEGLLVRVRGGCELEPNLIPSSLLSGNVT